MENCKVCGRKTTSRKDLYCHRHAMAKLKELDALGFFQPMVDVTVSGQHKLSNQRFLTQPKTSTAVSGTN